MASGSKDGAMIVWDLPSFAPLGTMVAEAVHQLAFSPDGSRLASGNGYRAVRLWDLSTFSQLALFRHESDVFHLLFNRDGTRLVSSGHDKSVRIWDLTSLAEEELARFNGTKKVSALALAPNGARLFILDEDRFDNAVWVWDMETFSAERLNEDRKLNFVGLSPDGQQIVFYQPADKIFKWFDMATLEHLQSLAVKAEGEALLMPNQERYLVRTANAFRLHQWPYHALLAEVGSLSKAYENVAYSPDGRWLVTGAQRSKLISLRDAQTYKIVAQLEYHSTVEELLFSRDSHQLLIVQQYEAWNWDLATPTSGEIFHQAPGLPGLSRLWPDGELPPQLVRYFPSDNPVDGIQITAAALDPSGQILALGMTLDFETSRPSPNGAIALWDLNRAEVTTLITGVHDDIQGLAFSPTDDLIASISSISDTLVQLWNTQSLDQVDSFSSSPLSFGLDGYQLAFSPDGTWLAMGGATTFSPSGLVAAAVIGTHFWNMAGQEKHRIEDGNLGTIVLWNPTEMRPEAKFEDHTRLPVDLAFSPDGTRLASVDSDGILVVRGNPDTADRPQDRPSDPPLPAAAQLSDNYPNPFNSTTVIPFALANPETVDLAIYNLQGQRLFTLLQESRPAGRHQVAWDGTDRLGHPLASGVYFYRLRTGNQSLTARLLLLR